MLQSAIAALLVEMGFYPKGDWQLAMAEPAAKEVSKQGDARTLAVEVVDELVAKLKEEAPPELIRQGEKAVIIFATEFGYNTLRGKLIEAAKRVNAK